MSKLYNKISNKILRTTIVNSNEARITISFYRYFKLLDPYSLRDNFYSLLMTLQILGRVYIATEGISAQISVPKIKFNDFQSMLYNFHPKLHGIELNFALDHYSTSFWVLRVKVKSRIVADGITDHTFIAHKTGHYLQAADVNTFLEKPEVLFVDIRNHYEYKIGHFKQAIALPANTFREQLSIIVDMLKHAKDQIIVIYCTGGIRCEKASAWLLHNGFKNIYQIKGGILGYVHNARKQNIPIKFIGSNFVFDARLSERVTSDILSSCFYCNIPCDNYINCFNKRCNLLFILCANCIVQYHGCCSTVCRDLYLR